MLIEGEQRAVVLDSHKMTLLLNKGIPECLLDEMNLKGLVVKIGGVLAQSEEAPAVVYTSNASLLVQFPLDQANRAFHPSIACRLMADVLGMVTH